MQSTSNLSSDLSRPEMGKILGKTQKLPPVDGRDAESPCVTSVFHDSEVEKIIGKKIRGNGKLAKEMGKFSKSLIRDLMSCAIF